MVNNLCTTCQRPEGDVCSRPGKSESREVSLADIYDTARSCRLCLFVKEVLERDATTPKLGEVESSKGFYSSAKVRVDDHGLRFTGQWQGALVIEIYAPDGQPKLPIPHDIPAEISCDFAATVTNGWLKSCEDHAECNSNNFIAIKARGVRDGGENHISESSFDPSLPKRMMKLGEDAKTAQLMRCPINPAPPYAALSYCWGGNGTFKTEKKTLRKHEKGIRLNQLPKTIQDAFCLAKKIGLDYIWVDAICIVQDDNQEWEQESQKMGHVYANAKIVLSATGSANVREGMFKPRSVLPISQDIVSEDGRMLARRNVNHEIIISCRTKSHYWWETHINTFFPLLSRGWGFQERMLATRIVHFTPSEIVWECQRCRKCECQVLESNLYPALNNLGSALRVCLKQIDDERSMRQMWREVVNSYSVRKLTQINDKLPALSGIASLLKERSGDDYIAGLWRRNLPFDLLWRCDQSVDLQIEKTRAPSWSWISVDGAVKWPISQQQNEAQPLKYLTSTTYFEFGAEGAAEGAQVSSVEVELDGEDAYGRVKAARITMQTRLARASIYRVEDEAWIAMYGTEWAVRVNGPSQAPFWPDLNREGLRRRRRNQGDKIEGFYVMEMMKSRNLPGYWEEALVVRLKHGEDGHVERVGVAANVEPTSGQWTTRDSWFVSSDVGTFTLA